MLSPCGHPQQGCTQSRGHWCTAKFTRRWPDAEDGGSGEGGGVLGLAVGFDPKAAPRLRVGKRRRGHRRRWCFGRQRSCPRVEEPSLCFSERLWRAGVRQGREIRWEVGLSIALLGGLPRPCLTPNAAVTTQRGPCFGAGVVVRPFVLLIKRKGAGLGAGRGGVGAADLEVR